jgi:hypothetical protein
VVSVVNDVFCVANAPKSELSAFEELAKGMIENPEAHYYLRPRARIAFLRRLLVLMTGRVCCQNCGAPAELGKTCHYCNEMIR